MRLEANQLARLLASLPDWHFDPGCGGTLTREFVFEDFAQAFGFMSQVALHAERRNHHPKWLNDYNRVTVTFTTHDVAGLSMSDIEMALVSSRIAAALAVQAH